MKVLQINCVYKTGSTGKIVYDIHTELQKRSIESIICYGRGKKVKEPNVYKTSSEFLAKFNNVKSRFTGMPYKGSSLATKKLLRIIKSERPNVVHLHCINGFFVNIYKLIVFLKKNKIPTVITHHAEFFYTGTCGHSFECDRWKSGCGSCQLPGMGVNSLFFDFTHINFKKMKKAFEGFDNVVSVAVSPWVEERAKQSPIFKAYDNTTVINGINCEIFKPRYSDLKKKLGIDENKKVVLHITASFTSDIKGGKYIIELAKRLGDDIMIVVVGNREVLPDLPDNIKAVGRVENQIELAEYYTMADLTVIASKRETFSMIVAESLSCGTPIVGFCAGGPETIAIPEYSRFVEFGNIDLLFEAVMNFFLKNNNIAEDKAKKIYCKERMTDNYIQLYKKIIFD